MDYDQQDSYQVLNGNSSLSEVNIPVKAVDRKKTDVWFWVVFASFVVVVIPFLIYTLYHSDLSRLGGYDHCGNICGQKNDYIEGVNCSGQDMTDKPIFGGECLSESESPKYLLFIYDMSTPSEYYTKNSWKIILLCLFPAALSLALAKFLQYATAVAVWILLVISCLSLVAITILHWLVHFPTVLIVLPGVAALIFTCVVIYNIRKMKLVILVLKESAKAVCKHHIITYVSLSAFILEALFMLPCVVITFAFISAGRPKVLYDDYLRYIKDDYMEASTILFGVLVIWVVHFIIGVHNMILSGAVIRGYFTKRQIDVKEAMFTSFLVTVRNHLSTVALQSILFCVVTPLVLVLYPLKLFSFTTDLVNRIFKYTDSFVSRNLCIVTAMHGTPFCQSGRKGVELLTASLGDTIAIAEFTNFFITSIQLIVICVSLIISFFSINERFFYIDHNSLSHFIVLAYCYVSTNTILESFKTASATIHLCIAQDCILNKEEAKPYNMSVEKFLDGSYELFATKVKNRPPPPVDDV